MSNYDSFFLQHKLDYLAQQIGITSYATKELIEYIANVGHINMQKAVKIVEAADSPSAQKLIQILKLDNKQEEEIEKSPKSDVVDEHIINQHDYRSNTTFSPQNEPATQYYSIFSVPTGESGSPSQG